MESDRPRVEKEILFYFCRCNRNRSREKRTRLRSNDPVVRLALVGELGDGDPAERVALGIPDVVEDLGEGSRGGPLGGSRRFRRAVDDGEDLTEVDGFGRTGQPVPARRAPGA